MIRIWDGFLSLLAALVTGTIIGVPLWGTYLAIQNGLVPGWVWVPLVLLALVGLVMVFAFLRKAGRGVHPMRERRR